MNKSCFYAIRHVPSGTFLPMKNGRGQTSVEPGEGPPRLFFTPGQARTALKWWLKGRVKARHTRRSYVGNYDFYDDYDDTLVTEPAPERRAKDMEIVEVVTVMRKIEEDSDGQS